MRKLYFIILLFCAIQANAQFEDQLWYFGENNYGIAFDKVTNTPTFVNNKHPTVGLCEISVICNPADGDLLFYSDGMRVIDKNHLVMPNGTGLLANYACNQPVAVVPVPGSCSRYYIFSNSGEVLFNNSGGIYYSILDLNLPGNGTLNNPSGDVLATSKNIFLESGTSESMLVVSSTESNQYWLLIPKPNSDQIKVFSITSSGINAAGTYNTGIPMVYQSCLKFNEQTNKLVEVSYTENRPIILMDFNRITGAISNFSTMAGTPFGSSSDYFNGIHSVEWSPDATKLYISKYRDPSPSSGGKIYQFDFNYPSNPPVLINTISNSTAHVGRGLKLAPDGKIYYLYTNPIYGDTRLIGVINSPNSPGLACEFIPDAMNFGFNPGNMIFFPVFLTYNNKKPVAENDYISSPDCITSTSVINVLANDSDPDNDNLTVSIIKVNLGSASVSDDNTVLYTAPQDYSGVDTLTYVIYDDACPSLNDTAIAVLCVNNNCYNDPPVALNDTVSICLDGGMTEIVLPMKNDFDPEGDQLRFTIGSTAKGMAYNYSDSSFKYVAPYLFPGVDSVIYLLCDESCNSICDSGYVYFCVNYQEILIPNLITPNHDRKNDTFEILGLYPNSSLEIYNRWGELTYSSKNYKNEWQGENCSDGIYYYYFSDPIREKQWKGWLQVLSKDL